SSSSSSSQYKIISLVVLIIQTTALILILRFSRTQQVSGSKYVSSTVVLVSEVVKVVSSFILLFKECNFRLSELINAIDKDVIHSPADFFKSSIPALFYLIQNNLMFLALSKLDAPTYQVTSQLKVLTTAFFTEVLLRRSIRGTQWISLFILTSGVALVQV
ncbi:hypothetical protein PENTCL1PPCAC_12721, partial [Pristionchus entomophagus]